MFFYWSELIPTVKNRKQVIQNDEETQLEKLSLLIGLITRVENWNKMNKSQKYWTKRYFSIGEDLFWGWKVRIIWGNPSKRWVSIDQQLL